MDNSKKVTHRLFEFMKYKDIGITPLERLLDTGNNTIRKALNEGRSISSTILEKLGEKYPDLDLNWLIRGVGAMEFGGEIPLQKEVETDGYKEKYFAILEKYTACLEAQGKEVN